MTLPRGGRGRRNNGLDAALWSPLTDVDPRVGEHLLDLLAISGIAAYLEPATDVGPYTRTVFLPSPPSDRLFVDRTRRGEARELLAGQGDQLPEPVVAPAPGPRPPTEDDLEFARIVAGFEADHGPVPDAEDVGEPRLDPPPRPAELSVLDALEAADHYQPPPPPPLPVLAPATLYALLLLVVGVLLVFRPGTFRLSADVGLVLGVAAVIGGVFVLVSRMRERSVEDGDDGAVV